MNRAEAVQNEKMLGGAFAGRERGWFRSRTSSVLVQPRCFALDLL